MSSTFSTCTFWRAISCSIRSMSPPGSTTAARPVFSQTSSEQFCWNGVTGMSVTFMEAPAAKRTDCTGRARGLPRVRRSARGHLRAIPEHPDCCCHRENQWSDAATSGDNVLIYV
ncbi:hypothetical protein BLAT2472_140011 [Burkholderia latens]